MYFPAGVIQKFKKRGIKTKNPDKPYGSSGFRASVAFRSNTLPNQFDFEENAAEKPLRVTANREVFMVETFTGNNPCGLSPACSNEIAGAFLVRAFAGRSRKTWPLEELTWRIPLRV